MLQTLVFFSYDVEIKLGTIILDAMFIVHTNRFLMLTLLITLTQLAFSANDPFDMTPQENDYDESLDKPWQEDLVNQLPPPSDESLLEIQIDHPPIGFKLFLDEESLQVSNSDSVIRYWLVLKAGKSRNVQYEGINCSTREYKIYAFENKWDKSKVKLNPVAKWEPIDITGHNQFREEMRQFYFCNQVLPRKREDILRRVKGYVNFDHTREYSL